jgi:low temperature requirement protein LtrA
MKVASRPDDGRAGRRWLRPPKLRTAEEGGGERRPTWTELFFDLVFVVAVERGTKLLEDDLSPHGFWRFAAVLLLVVWSWSNFVLYTERFDTDDVVHRLMKSAAMVAVAGVAVTAPSAADGNLVGLVVSFLAVRAVLVAFYARAWRHVPEARNATTAYLVGFTAGPLLLVSALLVPPSWAPGIVAAGVVVEVATPVAGWRALGAAAAHSEHLQERLGQFTLIVLGNVVAQIVSTLGEVRWDAAVAATTAAAAALVIALWWVNFEYAEPEVPRGVRGLVHVFGRLPAYVAVAALGVGAQQAIEHGGDPALPIAARWAIAGALAVYMLGASVSDVARGRWREDGAATHLLAAGTFVALVPLGGAMSPPVFVWFVAVALALLLLLKQWLSERRPGRLREATA